MSFQSSKIRSIRVPDATRPARIFADPGKLFDFVGGLTVDSEDDEVITSVNVASHRVRRYPGDPGFTRPATVRQRSNLYMKEGSSVTPGKNFYCEIKVANGDEDTTVATQFTYTGSWLTLRKYFQLNASIPFTLRRESGRSLEIAGPGGGGGII